jgi:hypothetical protein
MYRACIESNAFFNQHRWASQVGKENLCIDEVACTAYSALATDIAQANGWLIDRKR